MSDYKLIRELGHGGMGSVWYGLRSDGAECAVKCMLAKYVSVPDYREFFDSEAKAMRQLDHPSVVKIMGNTFTDDKGNLYLPMEYVQGETIEQRIKRTGQPFSEQEAIHIMADVLDAFAYIHRQGQIHRDIKPSNIMLRPDGRICVIDFGIAKDMKTSTGKTVGRQVGTSGYMSPEQISALNIDHRTDIYSLGCLLYYMLTAQHAIPKRANDYETMYAIQSEDFPSVRALRPDVSTHTEQVIYKATDKDMRKRYQNAEEFKAALLGNSAVPVASQTLLPLQQLRCMTGHWNISIGRQGRDINIHSSYVSSYHLDIELTAVPSTGPNGVVRTLTVTDHSTNGTGLNGRYLHNATQQIDYDILGGNYRNSPEILLAGREEGRLDWNKVRELLLQRMSKEGVPVDTGHDGGTMVAGATDPGQNVQTNTTDKPIGLIIISFLFPIVGWVVYVIKRTSEPEKAAHAWKAAWWGFGIGMAVNIIKYLAQ